MKTIKAICLFLALTGIAPHFASPAASPGGDEWEYKCMAVFADPWVTPLLAPAGESIQSYIQNNAWEVTVEQSLLNPNLIRLHNPYGNPAFRSMHPAISLSETQHIVIDLSDPERISIAPQMALYLTESGKQLYISDIYNCYLSKGFSPADIIGAGYVPSTFQSEVITISMPVFGYSMNDIGYRIAGADGFPASITGTITFTHSSINTITSTADEEGDEYFSLTGQRLISPLKGIPVVRRRGCNATIIIRP